MNFIIYYGQSQNISSQVSRIKSSSMSACPSWRFNPFTWFHGARQEWDTSSRLVLHVMGSFLQSMMLWLLQIFVWRKGIYSSLQRIYTLWNWSVMLNYFSAESYCVHLTSQIYWYLQFYNRASSVAEKIGDDFVTESAAEFLHSLQLDENGNLNCSVKIGGKIQKLHLNRHSKPSRS